MISNLCAGIITCGWLHPGRCKNLRTAHHAKVIRKQVYLTVNQEANWNITPYGELCPFKSTKNIIVVELSFMDTNKDLGTLCHFLGFLYGNQFVPNHCDLLLKALLKKITLVVWTTKVLHMSRFFTLINYTDLDNPLIVSLHKLQINVRNQKSCSTNKTAKQKSHGRQMKGVWPSSNADD